MTANSTWRQLQQELLLLLLHLLQQLCQPVCLLKQQ
jgi:hypothetical protein